MIAKYFRSKIISLFLQIASFLTSNQFQMILAYILPLLNNSLNTFKLSRSILPVGVRVHCEAENAAIYLLHLLLLLTILPLAASWATASFTPIPTSCRIVAWANLDVWVDSRSWSPDTVLKGKSLQWDLFKFIEITFHNYRN